MTITESQTINLTLLFEGSDISTRGKSSLVKAGFINEDLSFTTDGQKAVKEIKLKNMRKLIEGWTRSAIIDELVKLETTFDYYAPREDLIEELLKHYK